MLNVLNVLNVLNMPMDASSACWALLILERALFPGRDLLVRLYFRAIYHLGGMVLAFASLFYDFVVDFILHSSLFIILNLSKGNFGATLRSSLPHMSNFWKVV